jgi:hypothetical protein
MGFLDGLFGRSHDRKPVATDRCMDCGTAGGGHTEWCPSAEVTARPAPHAPASTEEAPDRREDAPGA